MKTCPKCSKNNGNSVRVCRGTHDAKTMRGDYCGHAFLKVGCAGITTAACPNCARRSSKRRKICPKCKFNLKKRRKADAADAAPPTTTPFCFRCMEPAYRR